jgi:hypothetical protein
MGLGGWIDATPGAGPRRHLRGRGPPGRARGNGDRRRIRSISDADAHIDARPADRNARTDVDADRGRCGSRCAHRYRDGGGGSRIALAHGDRNCHPDSHPYAAYVSYAARVFYAADISNSDPVTDAGTCGGRTCD